RIAFWFLVYSGLAITAAFFLAATWGAGQSVMPLSGAPRGTAVQEAAITAVSYSSAPTGIIAFALILWGLRTPSNRAAPNVDERRCSTGATGCCALWVKSRHYSASAQCPLYPRKRTLIERVGMSACANNEHWQRLLCNVE